jgi:hypothetical protein
MVPAVVALIVELRPSAMVPADVSVFCNKTLPSVAVSVFAVFNVNAPLPRETESEPLFTVMSFKLSGPVVTLKLKLVSVVPVSGPMT